MPLGRVAVTYMRAESISRSLGNRYAAQSFPDLATIERTPLRGYRGPYDRDSPGSRLIVMRLKSA